ncbi:MAG: hypothetical protein ILO34_02145 [Kiritimatiellae bacterium]|nr:hypothetical protein [Kiritimatiellia bacterium]
MKAKLVLASAIAIVALCVFAGRYGKMDAKIVLGRLALGDDTIGESALYGECAVVANAESDSVFCFDATGGRSRPPENAVAVDSGGRVCALFDARTGGRLPLIVRFSDRSRFGPAGLMAKNALGIRAAGEDAAGMTANESWHLAHSGGEIEGIALARMAAGAIRALPAAVRRDANEDGTTWLTALTLMRRAKKTATDDESYMSGATHAPLISASDIDERRLMELAAAMDDCITPPPVFTVLDCPAVATAPETDAYAFSVTGFAGRIVFRMKAATVRYARPAWRTLSDGGGKVEIRGVGDAGDEVDVEMSGFAAAGRVDIGCFAVAGPSDISIPAICSVNFPAPLQILDVAVSNLAARGYLAGDVFGQAIAAAYRERKIRGMKMTLADLPAEIRGEADSPGGLPVAMCDFTGDGLGDLAVDCGSRGVSLYERIREGGYRKIGSVGRCRAGIVPKSDGAAALLAISPLEGGLFAADLVEAKDGELSSERLCEGIADLDRIGAAGESSLFWVWGKRNGR